MSDPLVQTDNQGHQAVLDKLSAALGSGRMQLARRMLHGLHPAEIAHLLESLPRAQRNILWEFTDPEDDGEILINTNEEVRASLIDRMDEGQLVEALDGMAVDDVADILDDLPNRLTETVLESMSAQQRRLVEEVRLWPEDSAGGLMDTDVVTVRADVTLEVVQRFLRMRGSLPAHTDALYVLDRYGHYRGSLKLSHLLTEDPEQLVAEVIENDAAPIPVDLPDTQVSGCFADRGR
ncbi:MAG: magnesium transporter, partial [Gammaproteobacteria bacterium]|nr:magnesium transporter [Gammaproteobacteria bacterium]